jgi:leader peptidase (prepilin peptidase)/N-methyltransferase
LSPFLNTHFTNTAWAAIVASPIIGSFLGVVVERLPARRAFMLGRSECDACGHVLGPLDLIPFASWIFSAGRCRYCRTKLSVFYPLIELGALVVALWSATAATGWRFLAACTVGWLLLVAATISWRKRKRLCVPALALVVWVVWLYAPTILAQ